MLPVLGLDPEGAANLLLRALPKEWSLTFQAYDPMSASFAVKYSGNSEVFYCSIAIWEGANGRSGTIQYLEVSASRRNEGIGTQIVANIVDLAKQVGLMRIELLAAKHDGPYFWAGMGFVPLRSDWKEMSKNILLRLGSLAATHPKIVDDKVVALVQRALSSEPQRGILALIGLEDVVPFAETADDTGNGKLDRALGRILLTGNGLSWKGVLDLSDERSVRVLDERLTGAVRFE